MDFLTITSSDDMWEKVRQFAQNCSWRAGSSLSKAMSENAFTEWERVIVALNGHEIAGYCTVAKNDCSSVSLTNPSSFAILPRVSLSNCIIITNSLIYQTFQ